MTNKIAKEMASELLDIGAIELNPKKPFTWTSGLRSPIYTDNRLIISYPQTRNKVEQALAKRIRREFPEVEVIAGTATAGIPHASIIAHILDLPMIYVRSNPKNHGKQNAIEGTLNKGAKVVMVEDLISTGKSVIQAAETVQEAGAEVIGCAAIFNYLLNESEVAFSKVNYPLVTLTDYKILIHVATKSPHLNQYKETLEQWYQNPVTWSNQFSE
jgi:orotate phosphoribosyltransferase